MLRKFLLPALASAMLAGCATGYSYRGGNGDYYYGQPRVEYRYYGGFGYGYGTPYGDFGFGYYYDPYGRLVYGYPYGGYGYPFGYGNGYGGYPPRPRPGHGGDGDHHGHGGDHDRDRDDRLPPWRNPDRMVPRVQRDDDGDGMRPRRRTAPMVMPGPARESRPIAPRESRTGGDTQGSGSRMGRPNGGAKGAGRRSDE